MPPVLSFLPVSLFDLSHSVSGDCAEVLQLLLHLHLCDRGLPEAGSLRLSTLLQGQVRSQPFSCIFDSIYSPHQYQVADLTCYITHCSSPRWKFKFRKHANTVFILPAEYISRHCGSNHVCFKYRLLQIECASSQAQGQNLNPSQLLRVG